MNTDVKVCLVGKLLGAAKFRLDVFVRLNLEVVVTCVHMQLAAHNNIQEIHSIVLRMLCFFLGGGSYIQIKPSTFTS